MWVYGRLSDGSLVGLDLGLGDILVINGLGCWCCGVGSWGCVFVEVLVGAWLW